MKRVSILILALAVTGLMFAACGGGGGGGGGSSAVLRAVALFADTGYVD